MATFLKSRFVPVIGWALLMLALGVFAVTAKADPSSRVARLSVLSGEVSFSPAGSDKWHAANLNRPLVSGDRLYTENNARTELDLGAATARLDERSGFGILELDDRSARLELTEGTLNLRVHKLYNDQRYVVATPLLDLVISEPGEYRIDVDPQDNTARVTVFDGAGTVYGEGGARYPVEGDRSYRFDDSRLRAVAVQDLPRPDDFDNWCFARDERYDNALSRRYVADDMIGAADLDDYGSWDDTPSYGNVWYPSRVDAGWAPYRNGHWAWIDPWGWTWVDNAPWGFAPFHYGRWVYAGNRWGWLPGPVALRPVYAPALVVFVGGRDWHDGYSRGGAPVGWCPLGPRDVYLPPYSVSRGYFTHVNASNASSIDRDRISRSYEGYARGRPVHDRDYTHRHNPAAVTAVSRDTFLHARPVSAGRLHLKDRQLARTEIAPNNVPAPTESSRVPGTANSRRSTPRTHFNRGDNPRNAAPPTALPESTRTEVGSQSAGESAAARNRARRTDRDNVTERRAAPPSDDVMPRSRQAPRELRPLQEEPAARFAPSRESMRRQDRGSVERAPTARAARPVQRSEVNESPASQPDTVRTERRHSSTGSIARDSGRDESRRYERRSVEAEPRQDGRNRMQDRQTRRSSERPLPVPDDKPRARPDEPASSDNRRSSGGPAAPERHSIPRHERPSQTEQSANPNRDDRRRGRDARDRSAEIDAQGSGAPDR